MSCAIWCETSLISSGYILNIMYISTVYVVCVTSQGLLATKDRMDFCYCIYFNKIQFKKIKIKKFCGGMIVVELYESQSRRGFQKHHHPRIM